MSTTAAALTAHLVAPNRLGDRELRSIGDELHERFGIEHPTIQVEHGTVGECTLESHTAV